MVLKPSIYSMGDKGLLLLHYSIHTSPNCICDVYDIQPCLSHILESYNHWGKVTS